MENKNRNGIQIVYGVTADSPEEQVRAHGYTLGRAAKKIDELLNALFTLRFGVELSDSLYGKILDRINKKVGKNLERISHDGLKIPNGKVAKGGKGSRSV